MRLCLFFFIVFLMIVPGCHFRTGEAQSTTSPYFLDDEKGRFFKKSDIIAFTRSSFDNYKTYGVTFVSWGGFPKADVKSQFRFRKNIEEAYTRGVKIGAKIGTRTNFAGFIDFAPDEVLNSRCITLNGDPILVPGMEKRLYKGLPAYWFCTNSPFFQEYLKSNVKRSMGGNPYGMMMDDPLGTAAAALWFGGCYCQYCVAGFQKYLNQNYSKDELKSLGIEKIDSFDLRKFHQIYNDLPSYKRPLREQYIAFQMEKSVQLYTKLMSYAQKLRRWRIPVSANINPASRFTGLFFRHLDYFSCECPMFAETNVIDNSKSLLSFKIADMLNRPVAIMGTGKDHAHIAEEKMPGLVQCWVAEAYARGNYFLAPIKLWALSPKKGSHHYIPDSDNEIAPLYQFIRKNHRMFDGFESSAGIGVIYDYGNYVKNSDVFTKTIGNLAEHNILFDFIASTDKGMGTYLSSKILDQYRLIIKPFEEKLADNDENLMKSYISRGGIIRSSIGAVDDLNPIKVVGAEKIQVTLRKKTEKAKDQYTIHLLNRDYDHDSDACHIKRSFIIRIPWDLISTSHISNIFYIQSPALKNKQDLQIRTNFPETIASLKFQQTIDFLEVEIPDLKLWGILSIKGN